MGILVLSIHYFQFLIHTEIDMELPPANEVAGRYCFTGICHFVHSGVVYLWSHVLSGECISGPMFLPGVGFLEVGYLGCRVARW